MQGGAPVQVEVAAVTANCTSAVASDVGFLLQNLAPLFGFRKLIFKESRQIVIAFDSFQSATLSVPNISQISGLSLPEPASPVISAVSLPIQIPALPTRFLRILVPSFVKVSLALYLKTLPQSESVWFCQIVAPPDTSGQKKLDSIIVASWGLDSATLLANELNALTSFECMEFYECECVNCVDKLKNLAWMRQQQVQQEIIQKQEHLQQQQFLFQQKQQQFMQQKRVSSQYPPFQNQLAANSAGYQPPYVEEPRTSRNNYAQQRNQPPQQIKNNTPNAGSKKSKKYKPPPLPRYDDDIPAVSTINQRNDVNGWPTNNMQGSEWR